MSTDGRFPMPFPCRLDGCTGGVALVAPGSSTRSCLVCGGTDQLSDAERGQVKLAQDVAFLPAVVRILAQRERVADLYRALPQPPRRGAQDAYLRELHRLDGMQDVAAVTLSPAALGYLLMMSGVQGWPEES